MPKGPRKGTIKKYCPQCGKYKYVNPDANKCPVHGCNLEETSSMARHRKDETPMMCPAEACPAVGQKVWVKAGEEAVCPQCQTPLVIYAAANPRPEETQPQEPEMASETDTEKVHWVVPSAAPKFQPMEIKREEPKVGEEAECPECHARFIVNHDTRGRCHSCRAAGIFAVKKS